MSWCSWSMWASYPCTPAITLAADHLKHNVMKSKANRWGKSDKTVGLKCPQFSTKKKKKKCQPFKRPVFSGVGRHCSQHLLSRPIWSCIIKVVLPSKYNLLPIV